MQLYDEEAMVASLRANGGLGGQLEYKNDMHVWFVMHASKDEIASAREGRPIYHEAPYMGMKARDVKDYLTKPATAEDIEAHPREWEAFQSMRTNPKTSLRCLPKMTMAAFLTLQEMKVASIEDFAARATVYPELESLHAIAKRWVSVGEEPKAKGGWPKGKARKAREDAQAAA